MLGLIASCATYFAGVRNLSSAVTLPSSDSCKYRLIAEILVCATIKDRASAARLGEVYLRTAVKEQGLDWLVGQLLSEIPEAKHLISTNKLADLASKVRLCIRKDFEDDRVVNVSGWLVSATEARLAALAELL